MPQDAVVRYVVDGGIYVHSVVGAVPVMVVAGLVVAVPPLMSHVVPAAETAGWNQVVTNVSVVLPASTAPVVRIYSPVYGLVALFNWNKVVAAAPGVKLYQPVVVANVVCVPPLPPIRVVPVYDVPKMVWAALFTLPVT